MSTYVIAEAGSCHDGNIWKAARLVEAAASAGANAVKFQYWSDANALADRRKVPQHYRDIYARYQIPEAWLPTLQGLANGLNIDFMCTAYLACDVQTVAPYVKHFKIASFEAGADDLLAAHHKWLKWDQEDGSDRMLIISLGMGALTPCGAAMPYGLLHRVSFLHCVSAYPAPVEALNLMMLSEQHIDGLSDHTPPNFVQTGGLAVAAGAKIIEAHLRLIDTSIHNPDGEHAMNANQFAEYVAHIRFAERCMIPRTGMHESENEMAKYRVRQ